jgi:hypothetical protein
MTTTIEDDIIRIVQHPGQGFFSCCTVQLQRILFFYNTYHRHPRHVDSSQQFLWYKTPEDWERDIKPMYFDGALAEPYIEGALDRITVTDQEGEEQYTNYQYLNHRALAPMLRRYFTLAPDIKALSSHLQDKYTLRPPDTCVLFYRGNDKALEIKLPEYDVYVTAAREVLSANPALRFWIQSDETEFLEHMVATFPDNHVVFWQDIRHIPKTLTTVDRVYRHINSEMSQRYLAITHLMSQCKYVICNSGNCSLWIALFRGHSDGILQM